MEYNNNNNNNNNNNVGQEGLKRGVWCGWHPSGAPPCCPPYCSNYDPGFDLICMFMIQQKI